MRRRLRPPSSLHPRSRLRLPPLQLPARRNRKARGTGRGGSSGRPSTPGRGRGGRGGAPPARGRGRGASEARRPTKIRSAGSDAVSTDSNAQRPTPSGSPGAGNAQPPSRGGRGKDDRGGRASLSVVLPGSKETRLLEANPQSQAIEHRLCEAKMVPYGNSGLHHSHSTEGNVGGVSGPEGCVLAHPHSSDVPTVSGVRVPRGELQIYGSPLRAFHVPKGIFPGRGSRGALATRHTALRVSGRLARPRGLTRASRSQRRSHDHPSPTDGLGDQLGKVTSHPYPGTGLSRGTVGLREGESLSHLRQDASPSKGLYLNSWRIHGAQPRVGSES